MAASQSQPIIKPTAEDMPLVYDVATDYTLKPEHTSCWITVDNLSVYVKRTAEGATVSIYPVGREADDEQCLASAVSFFADGGKENPVKDEALSLEASPKYGVYVVWGEHAEEEQIKKPPHYEFNSQAELKAFLCGINAADGYLQGLVFNTLEEQQEYFGLKEEQCEVCKEIPFTF
jgi:hypothetical protein